MFEYKEQYSHLTDACLNITDACNLACRYCFVVQEPHYMNLDTAKDAVKYLIRNLEWKQTHGFDQKRIRINFFGGEPMLLYQQIIHPLVIWINEEYPNKVDFGITTNGTLLTTESLEFFKKNNFGLLLSIDGAPKTQDFNRPCHNSCQSSSELILKNVPTLLRLFPETTFRSTIDEHTVNNTFENYIFAQYAGFKNIFMIPNGRIQWQPENIKVLENEFKKIYMYIIKNFENHRNPPINFSNINRSFTNILQSNLISLQLKNKGKRNCVRCGLGTSFGSISYDGTIYGCQEQDSQEQESRFYLGNIYDGIDQEKHASLLKEYMEVERVTCGEYPEYCDTCPLSNICGTLNCPSSSYDVFQTFSKDHYIHCFYRRMLNQFSTITLKYLEDNQTFRQYLINQCDYSFLRKE